MTAIVFGQAILQKRVLWNSTRFWSVLVVSLVAHIGVGVFVTHQCERRAVAAFRSHDADRVRRARRLPDFRISNQLRSPVQPGLVALGSVATPDPTVSVGR